MRIKVTYEEASCILHVLDLGGEFVGFVTNVHTPPKHRRRNMATKLMTMIMREAKEHNCERVCLCTGMGNDRAMKLYLKTGFKPCGLGFRKEVE